MSLQSSSRSSSAAKAKILQKQEDDVVIVAAYRTAITKVCLVLFFLSAKDNKEIYLCVQLFPYLSGKTQRDKNADG